MSETKKETGGQSATTKTVAVQKAKSKTATEKTTTEKSGTVMYIGPAIKGVVAKNMIFSGKLPTALSEKEKEIPALHSLLIPIEDLPEARKKLKEGNSSIRTCYDQVLFLLQNEGGN